jgi:hypothetical protein
MEAGRPEIMADYEESVLFEQSNVKVTTRRFIILDQGSYRLSEFLSAEVGHHTPRAADWMGYVIAAGVLMAGLYGMILLLGIPSAPAPEDFDPATQVLPKGPPEFTWLLLLGGVGIAAIGTVLMAVLNGIWGKSIVRVETISDESKILFESRNRKLVEGIVKAINKAVAQ